MGALCRGATVHAAPERMAPGPRRVKVTLVWDRDDVLKIFDGMTGPQPAPKLMELPTGQDAAHPYDQVRHHGRMVGLSTFPTCSVNERAWISLAMVRADLAVTGTRLDILWGEANGGSAKPHVERHVQIGIGAEVQPWPIHEATRLTYRRQAWAPDRAGPRRGRGAGRPCPTRGTFFMSLKRNDIVGSPCGTAPQAQTPPRGGFSAPAWCWAGTGPGPAPPATAPPAQPSPA